LIIGGHNAERRGGGQAAKGYGQIENNPPMTFNLAGESCPQNDFVRQKFRFALPWFGLISSRESVGDMDKRTYLEFFAGAAWRAQALETHGAACSPMISIG
jgi:hypothetical protein